MMKTKLKTMIGAIRPDTGKGKLVQTKFTLRKFFAVFLLAMVVQIGLAETVECDFTKYQSAITFQQGSQVSTVNSNPIHNLIDNSVHATDNKIAVWWGWNTNNDGSFKSWWWTLVQREVDGSQKYCLYNNSSGGRYLSVLRLYTGTKVTIRYYDSNEGNKITFVDGSQVVGNPTGNVTSNQEYTMTKDGNLDLNVPRNVHIAKITVDYGDTKHLLFTDQTGYSTSGYKDGFPYYRYRLSSRRFDEPVPSVFPAGSGSYTYEYSVENYGTNAKSVALMNPDTNGDILFKNLGWCKVTVIAKQNGSEVARGSYLVEVWDNEAYYIVDKNSNGVPYKYRFAKDPAITDDNQQGGVLKTRTVTAIPGITMKFGIPNDNSEPNTTVVYKYTVGSDDHMVSFTNGDNGWWDRVPNDNSSWPTQGTFYSFHATVSGKLKFGGVKPYQSGNSSASDYKSNAGGVYLVKITDGFPKTWVFSASQSGYLETSGTINDENGNPSMVNGEIDIVAGVTYYLQGEANRDGNKWTPFLLEWFSYETSLELSKSYGVASKPGKEISETITTDAKVTLNDAALSVSDRTYINNNITIVTKGHINGATVSLNSSDYITISNITYNNNGNEDLKGGAIKVMVKNGNDVIEYVYTIPYGKHVWDFRNTTDQTGASRRTDTSYSDADLCSNMKANTSDWSRVYKVHSKSGGSWSDLKDPLMVAGSKIEGDNAFYMSNTAGLIFVTNDIESFGAQQTGFPEGYSSLSVDDQYLQGVDKISATNLVWMKGTSTIYFPGVKPNQYIKIYTYRHADDKGENYYVRNLVDLDGKSYSSTNATDYIKIRGASEETGNGIKGDNISGAAIFRVSNSQTETNDLNALPSLTLCDDGWAKIFRIEITDEYYPDLMLHKDISDEDTERDDYVTYDSKTASVVLRNHGGTITPVTTYYLGTSGNVHAQHANTPKYQVIPDAGVTVTASIENWNSNRYVDYNRLKLEFSGGNGNVRIIQREVANHAGNAVLVGHSDHVIGTKEVEMDGTIKTINIYEQNTPITLISSSTGLASGDYVIDKKEYRIAVGELAVQAYPYTWDFTDYNFGNTTTQTNMNGSSSSDSWKWTGTWPSKTLTTKSTKKMGEYAVTNPNNDPYQELYIDVPMFAQGADLKAKNGSTTVIAECEGLGVAQPLLSDGKKYNMTNDIILNGNNLSGAGTITIPEVDNGMYIFVSLESGGSVPYNSVRVSKLSEVETDEYLTLSALYQSTDIFGLRGGVYAFQQNKTGTRDVIIPVSGSIKEVAVTNIVKEIGTTGYATESRDHAIDHTYQGKLTNHDVNAYAITTYDISGETYNYRGYPEVKKSAPVSVVPEKTGIVLYEDLPSGTTTHTEIHSPLFYPAVNNVVPTAADNTELAKNWMAPSIGRHDESSGLAADGVYMGSPTIDKGLAQTGTNNGTLCTKFILSNVYWVYEKGGIDPGVDPNQLNETPNNTAAFYRLRTNGDNFLGPNKAYLLIPSSKLPTALWEGGNGEGVAGSAREGIIYIDLEDLEENNTTAIDNAIIESSKDDDMYYSIWGARISGKPNKKGFYIHNGKKVSVK